MWGEGDLPDEVAMAILSLLDYEDLLNVSLANRRSYAVCNDSSLWHALLDYRRPWRAEAPPQQDGTAPPTVGGRRLDERLAFYGSLVANLDPSACQLFLRTSSFLP
jgi:hypothetical protein